jgi:hypothetical protein
MISAFHDLDSVVLLHDIPDAGLVAGDIGVVVYVHSPESVEVEFVLASGATLALETLSARSIRMVRDDDTIGVRRAAADDDRAVVQSVVRGEA